MVVVVAAAEDGRHLDHVAGNCDTSVMPCPFFEPQTPVPAATVGGRLPLIDEYDGLCHAGPEPVASPETARFRFCNHGNSLGNCSAFPADEKRSALRYELISRENGRLRVLCIEEQGYTPGRWYAVEYASGEALNPEPENTCVRSQIVSFCRSYLARFPE